MPGRIVTFYSYKGGVGRSMAVANIGILLALQNTRVLLVDWDLEAPGLDLYFTDLPRTQPERGGGLVGLLHGLIEEPSISFRRFCTRVDFADRIPGMRSTHAALDMLPSGSGTSEYPSLVSQFSWERFFSDANGGELLERLRDEWRSSYDFVLIDSRTGITDAGGICTILMPDALVLMFAANEQNVAGALDVGRRALAGRQRLLFDRFTLPIYPLLSRFDGRDEVALAERWLDRISNEFAEFFRGWLPEDESVRDVVVRTKIPYLASLSFGEPLTVLTHGTSDPDLPGYYYRQFADLLLTYPSADRPQGKDAVSSPASGPQNLPSPSLGERFVGRDAELAVLRDRFVRGRFVGQAPAARIQVIHGLGGIGKTQLALEYAWRHLQDYTATLYVRADYQSGFRRNLGDLSGLLELPQDSAAGVDARVTAVLEWLSGHPGWLLILDGLDDPDAQMELEQILSGLHGGHVLVTSRTLSVGSYFDTMTIGELDEGASVAFLETETAGVRRTLRSDSEDVRALAAVLGGVPLALEQAAAFIRTRTGMTYRSYVEALKEAERRHAARSNEAAHAYPVGLVAAWSRTLEQLLPTSRALLGMLSWLAPAPLPAVLFVGVEIEQKFADACREALADSDAIEKAMGFRLDLALGELRTYSILSFRDEAGGQWVLHPLFHAFLRTHLEDRMRQATRHSAWVGIAAAAPPTQFDEQAWILWNLLAPHCRALLASLRDHAQESFGIMLRFGQWLYFRGEWTEAEAVLRRVLPLQRKIDPQDAAEGLATLGRLLHARGELHEAEIVLRDARSLAANSYGDSSPKVAEILTALSKVVGQGGQLHEALQLSRQALDTEEKAYGREHPAVARSLTNLGDLLAAAMQLEEAESVLRRALAINETSLGTTHPEVASSIDALARLLQRMGRLAEAEPLLRRALSMNETAYGPEHPTVATSLNNLGVLLRHTGQIAAAESLLRRASRLYEQHLDPGDPTNALVLNNLAEAIAANGKPREAEPLMRRALRVLVERNLRSKDSIPELADLINAYQELLEHIGLNPTAATERVRQIATGEDPGPIAQRWP